MKSMQMFDIFKSRKMQNLSVTENFALGAMDNIWLSNYFTKQLKRNYQHASIWRGRCMNAVFYPNQKSVEFLDAYNHAENKS